MADEISKLTIGVGFDVKQLSNSAKQVENTIGDLSKNIGDKLNAALGVLTTGFGLNTAKNLIEGFANTGANLQLLSQSINENVSTLGTWQQAVMRVGGTAEGFNSTLKGLYDRINNAIVQGDPNTTGILSILGISPTANGKIKQTSVLLKEIIDQLRKQPERLRMQFGKQLGLDDATLRLTQMSSKEVQTLFQNVEKLGIISAAQAERSLRLKQSWQNVSQVWGIAAFNIADKLFPELEKLGTWISQNPAMVQNLTVAVAGLTVALVSFTAIRTGILALSAAFGVLRIGMVALTGPVGIILTALGGIYEIFNNRNLIKDWAKQEDLQWLVDLMEKLDAISTTISERWKNAKAEIKTQGISNNMTTPTLNSPHDMFREIVSMFKGGSKEVQNFVKDEKLAYAQMMAESSGRTNIDTLTKDSKGNIHHHVGLFQIDPVYASKIMGKNISIEDLKNPKMNRQIRDELLAEDFKLAKGNKAGALSWFNAGAKGYQNFLKSGQSPGGYAEGILSSAQKMPLNTTNNSTKQTNVSINTMQLHGMQNPREFVQGLADTTATGWAFSGSRLA
jgi:hypothetical protein